LFGLVRADLGDSLVFILACAGRPTREGKRQRQRHV